MSNDDWFGSLLGIFALGGMYVWGKSKGHEKATFQYGAELQQREINSLKAEMSELKRKMQISCEEKNRG